MKKQKYTIISLLMLILGLTTNVMAKNPFFLTQGKSYVQNSPIVSQMQWNQTYRGQKDDYCYALIQTTDGGFALAGVTNYEMVGGNSNMWLIKTDANGGVEWDQTYGGEEADEATALIQTSDKGFALVGYSSSFDASWLVKTDRDGVMQWNQTFDIIGCYARTILQTHDGGFVIAGHGIFLMKTDADGIEQWNHTYKRSGMTYGDSFTLTNDDGFALTGSSSETGDTDIWLVKTDTDGIEQWNRTYGGTGYDRAYSVLQIADGGFILAGETSSYGEGECDMYLVKTDANGLLQWNKTYGGSDADSASSLVQTKDGGYAFTGGTSSYGGGKGDMWLVKTDANGVEQWNQTFGGPNLEYAITVLQTTDGGFALAGITRTYGDVDIWLVKTNGSTEEDNLTPGFTVMSSFVAILPIIILNKKRNNE